MLRRRTAFSTPFVVVLGCSQPVERPVTPGSGRGSDTAVPGDAAATSPDDADEVARIRNGILDAQSKPCVASLDRKAPRCNPPAPTPDAARIAAVREGDVVDVQAQADGVYFKALMATGNGPNVGWKWRGVFLDGNSPISDSEFKIVRLEGSMMSGFLAGKRDVPSRRIRMTEPEGQ